MGTCYTVIMMDELDWGYADRTKESTVQKINEFLKAQGYGGEVVSQFYHGIVISTEKQWPHNKDLNRFISCNCDSAYYFYDCTMELTKLLPVEL